MSDGRGGRRPGAGRPRGSGWTAAVAKMRTENVARVATIVNSSKDPLEIALSIAADTSQDTATRLQACGIALPFVYPKLSAASVNTTSTNINVDAGQLLDRLDERIERLRSGETAPLIEVQPAADADEEKVPAPGPFDGTVADEV